MAVKKRKMRRSSGDLTNRKWLMSQNTASEEVNALALKYKEKAFLHAGLAGSLLTSWLGNKCHYQIMSTALPTFAVVMAGDGTTMLVMNPEFAVSIGEEGTKFVLEHEKYHVVLRHLYSDQYLMNDDLWELATEAGINHLVMQRLKVGMPMAEREVTDPVTGAVTIKKEKAGVDPNDLYKRYAKDLTDQGLTPLEYKPWIATDFVTYTELKRMKNPPSEGTGGMGECIHSEAADGNGEGGVPMDQETLDRVAKQILHNTMHEAVQGKERAREELLALAERSGDSPTDKTSKIWGDLGIGRLRGETPAVRRVDWWKRWLNNTVASKLTEGDRLRYDKNRGVIDMVLGNQPMLSYCGDEEEKVVLLACDTSGSMPEHVINYLTRMLGFTDGVEFHHCAFDGVLTPFRLGERPSGGGGTNFKCVQDYAEGRLEVNGHRMTEHPDAVIMLTDGYASPIQPEQPEKWIWLITEGGSDDWIKSQDTVMASFHIATGEGENTVAA